MAILEGANRLHALIGWLRVFTYCIHCFVCIFEPIKDYLNQMFCAFINYKTEVSERKK